MSHKEDCCFLCQKLGHIACHCPSVQCLNCDEYSHIVWIACTGYHLEAHLHITTDPNLNIDITVDQSHTTITDRYRCSRSRSQSCHHRYHSKSCHDSYRGHSSHTTGTTEDITGIVYGAHTQVLIHIILIMTLHTADHLHIGALQLTQETTADHALDQATNQTRKPRTNLHYNPEDHKVKHMLKGI